MSGERHIEDHGHEIRMYGPPGTGKTTRLTARIRSTVIERGASSVMVGSFTTTAAAELAGRGLPLAKNAIGTLHSHAYRALGNPLVHIEHLADFNAAHPALALTISGKGGESALDDPQADTNQTGATDGDQLLAQVEYLRNRLVPTDRWPAQVRRFHDRYEAWKKDAQVIDFTDMIELALTDTVAAPTSPEVGFFDEVQDQTPLELALIDHWGKRMDRVVKAGDDDQMIYRFRGADPDALLANPVPEQDTIILGQSYRIPRMVHLAAEMWVRRLSKRVEKPYAARQEDGVCRLAGLRYDEPTGLVRAIEADVQREVVDHDTGEMRPATVMVLSTCAYMLDPLKHELRKQGMPFHNPYRAKRSDWNPLGGNGRGVSSRERLLAYLAPDEELFGEQSRLWTGDDVRKWLQVVKTQGSDVFRHGVKKLAEELAVGELSEEAVMGLFRDDAPDELVDRVVGPDLEWFAQSLTAAARPGMSYPVQVAKKRGPLALRERPQVTIGTIHSVKGGEADIVYLLPDLSQRGMVEFSTAGDSRDSVIRQFYVGMTRARQELVVCAPSTDAYVPGHRLVQGARQAA